MTLEDSHQAYTYAAHPEIAAVLVLLTNGREFRVYRFGDPDNPIVSWKAEDTDRYLVNIINLLGPDAIKKRVHVPVDLGKPLTLGFGSSVDILGGFVTYERHRSSAPLFAQAAQRMNGMRAAVTGKQVIRLADGRIQAQVEIAGPYSIFDSLNNAMGLNSFLFLTSDEYISATADAPSIFQNVVLTHISRGTVVPLLPEGPAQLSRFVLPFNISVTTRTEAIGYIDGDRFRGTSDILYEYRCDGGQLRLPIPIEIPREASMFAECTFELNVR